MHKGWSKKFKNCIRASLVAFLLTIMVLSGPFEAPGPNLLPVVRAQTVTAVGSVTPAAHALLVGSSGNVRVDIPKPGIAVRIEIPRDFLQGVVSGENDTHFITSNIRNDYYYYSVVDESAHWTYDWRGTDSDGPCFKPNFSFYDPNAPYCVEIWNYLNYPGFKQPVPNFDYCANKNATRWVFNCFSPPRFVLFRNLNSPAIAGGYNFTLFIANRTNTLGYPDFVHAYNATLFVPVSMAYNAGFIAGYVCDAGTLPMQCNPGPIRGKGIVYALSEATGNIVARSYLNQSLCQASGVNCGLFNLTGLAPGNYQIEGAAGVDHGQAYSLTPCCSGGPPFPTATIYVRANGSPGFTRLPLRRSPVVCGSITYQNPSGAPINSLSGNPYLIAAGFGLGNPSFELNVTVEGTDPLGHVFRYESVSTGTSSDSFNLTTGTGVRYVGTDPYGTEFAGLPAPEDFGSSGYTITVKVWVSGYVQFGGFPTVLLLQSPGTTTPSCSPSNQPTVLVNMHTGGVITGLLRFLNSPQNLESPCAAELSLPITASPPLQCSPLPGEVQGALFGGNVVVQAYDQSGRLSGVTVIDGTGPDGSTQYANAICQATDYTGHCAELRFYIIGFSEYYNHTLSGVWKEHDYGLPDGTYSLQVYVRGYELTSTSPTTIAITNGSNGNVTVDMIRGGAFEVTVSSYDNRFGSRAVQAMFQWRFLNSSIPVRGRVYFYDSSGRTVGYVEALMESAGPNELAVAQFTTDSFKVVFAGQNWSLREIWFYGDLPTHITNDNYTLLAYTLGYVRQFPNGVSSTNNLVGFSQVYIALFIANEFDTTVPVYHDPQTRTATPEYDHSIGEVFSTGLSGAETANLTAGVSTLSFNVFGFGGMQLGDTASCETVVLLRGPLPLCGQGHFYYVGTDGIRYFDYGLDVGNYTEQVPEFGFTAHFLQTSSSAAVQFKDLFLQAGVVVNAIEMGLIMQGPGSTVSGYNEQPPCLVQLCVVPLSWAQVTATNSSYSRFVPTVDGTYDGVDALFLPEGTYNVTFSDLQYQSQTFTNYRVGWGSSNSLTPPFLCPTGITC
jgi:hypothetical protein